MLNGSTGFCAESGSSQGQVIALTVLFMPNLLDCEFGVQGSNARKSG
jgi:hypothetical protein